MRTVTLGQKARTLESPDRAARARIQLAYLWRHGRFPKVDNPRLFTEWVQWRKLFDRSPHHTHMMDKLAAKKRVETALGRDWIIPTLWSGPELPSTPPVMPPAMLKARHGCNQFVRFPDPVDTDQWNALRARANRWCTQPYGRWLDEPAYRDVPRGLLIEPFVSDTDKLPVDYKIYVFGGRATHVQVHLGREGQHRWILHDRNFRPLVATDDHPSPPGTLAAMLDAAEELAAGEDFMRIDFYEVRNRPLFGEFCLYPGSGLDPFAAPWIDNELGNLWAAARRASASTRARIGGKHGTWNQRHSTIATATSA